MRANFGNLLGLVFSFGIMFAAKPFLTLALKKRLISDKITKFANDSDFAYKVVFALISGSVAALGIGVWLRLAFATMLALPFGAILGLRIAEANLKNRAVDYDLRLRLSSGAFIDVISLCMNSGLPIRSAIVESCQRSGSEITNIWQQISRDLTAEIPFTKHLADISIANRENVMGRIARTLLISQERGTPITATLNSLSAEIRSETRRQLLEIAAKKDVAMMVPVVFGILPSITAVALYPAFISLSIM